MLLSKLYKNERVLVTGHTGFKGSWLSLWLQSMGAEVAGLSIGIPTAPAHISLLQIPMADYRGDIADYETVQRVVDEFKPTLIFHLAAQPLVRKSYQEPLETIAANVTGTANVLEASRIVDCLRGVLVVTSDKCYENQNWEWGYRESDPLGGHDPYSASKACAEILASSYRRSFFSNSAGGKVLIATARGGNVLGGGDWGEDRLIPDIMRAAEKGLATHIRNPYAVRPWQHVLDLLHGYLLLGAKLLGGEKEFARAWNFGPTNSGDVCTVQRITELVAEKMPAKFVVDAPSEMPHEAALLALDASLANKRLNWRPVLNLDETLHYTVDWYSSFMGEAKIITRKQLIDFVARIEQSF